MLPHGATAGDAISVDLSALEQMETQQAADERDKDNDVLSHQSHKDDDGSPSSDSHQQQDISSSVPGASSSSSSSSSSGVVIRVAKTPAELRYEATMQARAAQHAKRFAQLSHREKITKFNSYLDSLSEHNDSAWLSYYYFLLLFLILIPIHPLMCVSLVPKIGPG